MRSCENCGANVPAGATSCPECGVYAGKYVEGQAVHPRKPRIGLALSFLAAALVVTGVSMWMTKPHILPLPFDSRREPPATSTAPIRVVKDRPGGARRGAGATITEPEAILRLRRHFTSIQGECVAILSQGYRDGAYHLTAVNRCDGTRLGRWRVDGRTGAVGRAL